GNAELLRFVPLIGRWFVWDGRRWEMDVRLTAREHAKATCRAEAQRCNKGKAAKACCQCSHRFVSRTVGTVLPASGCYRRSMGQRSVAIEYARRYVQLAHGQNEATRPRRLHH